VKSGGEQPHEAPPRGGCSNQQQRGDQLTAWSLAPAAGAREHFRHSLESAAHHSDIESHVHKSEMASTKRIPKRSIIGARVTVKCVDGFWRPGVVAAMRSSPAATLFPGEKKFSVRLEMIGSVLECREAEIVGPGFLTNLPVDTRLLPGQGVFVTNGGREVEGQVAEHDFEQDLVEVVAKDIGPITKRLEDIRLMESRKSARLLNTDTDFSRLADFNIVEQRKLLKEVPSRRRLHSMSDFHDRKRQKSDVDKSEKRRQRSERGKSSNIEVPTLTSQSRKRRTSESRAEADSGYASSNGSGFFRNMNEDTNVKECTAAMVLMNLSASPRDKWLDDYHNMLSLSTATSSEICSSPITPRPSPATSCSHLPLDEDEEPFKRTKRSSVIFECTWRGCFQRDSCQEGIERHVRQHLGLPEPGPDTIRDYEEEFYYTEIEQDNSYESFNESGSERSGEDHSENINVDVVSQEHILAEPSLSPTTVQRESSPEKNISSSSAALGDHIGMVRPSYEAPTTIYVVNSLQTSSPNGGGGGGSKTSQKFLNVPYSLQGKKFVSIVPKPESEDTTAPNMFKSLAGGLKSDKKCRKVYGIEQKELWCTQCKWKKACGRFAQT